MIEEAETKEEDIPVKDHGNSNRFTPAVARGILRQISTKKLRVKMVMSEVRTTISIAREIDGGTYSSSTGRVCFGPTAHWGQCGCGWDMECESLGWGEKMYLGKGMGGEDDHCGGKFQSTSRWSVSPYHKKRN